MKWAFVVATSSLCACAATPCEQLLPLTLANSTIDDSLQLRFPPSEFDNLCSISYFDGSGDMPGVNVRWQAAAHPDAAKANYRFQIRLAERVPMTRIERLRVGEIDVVIALPTGDPALRKERTDTALGRFDAVLAEGRRTGRVRKIDGRDPMSATAAALPRRHHTIILHRSKQHAVVDVAMALMDAQDATQLADTLARRLAD